MKLILIITALFSVQLLWAQKVDKDKITSSNELNISETDFRGMEAGVRIYYVDKDLQTLSCFEKGKLLWKKNIVQTCENLKSKSTLSLVKRYIETLEITYSDNKKAHVVVTTGEVICVDSK